MITAVRYEPRFGLAHYGMMQTSDDAALALLQTLLRVALDSAEGYREAAIDLSDPALVHELERFQAQHAKLGREIQQRIRDLHGNPEATPTLAGAIHRRWIDIRAAGGANPARAVLSEVERGEDLAVSLYRQALKQHDIDAATRALVQRHYEVVQTAHDRIRYLRDHVHPASPLPPA